MDRYDQEEAASATFTGSRRGGVVEKFLNHTTPSVTRVSLR